MAKEGILMFDQDLIKKKFEQIGTKVNFNKFGNTRKFQTGDSSIPLTVDVKDVKGNEEFEIVYDESANFELSVIDLQPEDKHLLLMLKEPVLDKTGNIIGESKIKLLCGHDERHYFSCGIPESASVSTVTEAKKALLPPEFTQEHKKKGKSKNLLKRKNEIGFRQGEWLFVRDDDFKPENPINIKHNEPISRGGGSKPHICEEVYTFGGEKVYVHSKWAPNGVTEGGLSRLKQSIQKEGVRGGVDFQVRTRNAIVYARGYVRHPDHKTIVLKGWHRVYMNTENKSKASKFSVFLD
jgi:hypothetical protein